MRIYIYIYPKSVSDSCSEYFSRFWWRYWDFSEPLVESPTSNKCRSAIPEVLNSQSLFSELVGHTIWQPTLAPTSSSSTSLWPSLVRRFLGLHLCLEEEGSNWSRRLDFYKWRFHWFWGWKWKNWKIMMIMMMNELDGLWINDYG